MNQCLLESGRLCIVYGIVISEWTFIIVRGTATVDAANITFFG